MRGFFKAAALLLSNSASALVIPDTAALDGRPTDPIVDYDYAQAQLKFVINTVEPAWGYPLLTLDVGPSERLCGDSNLELDGQRLESSWSGIQGIGEGSLAAYGGARMTWTITCLWDPSDASPGDITHLLTLSLSHSQNRRSIPSFTVSYKQSGRPSIVRFKPYHITPARSNDDYAEWRTPASPFATEDARQPQSAVPEDTSPTSLSPVEAPFQLAPTEQKSLSSKVKSIEDRIKSKFHGLIEACKKFTLCPKAGKISKQGDSANQNVTRMFEDEDKFPHDELEISQADEDLKVTHVSPPASAQTRDLHSFDDPTDSLAPNHNGIPSAVVLKSFFLSLLLLSLLTWIILRCRDPRRRADRAAQQEERRTKRLYRNAARKQAVKNWVWQTRLKYGLVCPYTLREEEKRRHVAEQDAVLEKMMEEDIRALRHTHGAVTSMTGANLAAEEGRSAFFFEEGEASSHRRLRSVRSVSTLPGYESEGTQPPGYDEQGRTASVTEFTSDSSVISTSPRISRDGTNSEFDEKMEELNLDEPPRSGAIRK